MSPSKSQCCLHFRVGGGNLAPIPPAQAGAVVGSSLLMTLCSESISLQPQAWREGRPGGREGPEQ